MTFDELHAVLADNAVIQRLFVHRATGRRAHVDTTIYACGTGGKPVFVGARMHYYDGGFEELSIGELFAGWDIGRLVSPPGTASLDMARKIGPTPILGRRL